jgi:hypothetical protein
MYSPGRTMWVAASLLFSLQFLRAQTEPDAYDPGPDETLIEKGLTSTLPLQVAISAYRAKQDSRHQRWGLQLRQALVRSIALQPEADAVRTRRIILDALIQSRSTAPLEELLPFFNQFPAAVIALIARTDNANATEDRVPLLISTEGLKNRLYWSAAASTVDRKRLIHHLAERAWFDYPIYVSDRDFVPVPIFALPGIASGVIGGVISGVPDGKVPWPSETTYRLSASGRQDETLPWGIGGQTYLIAERYDGRARAEQPDIDPDWDKHDKDILSVLLSFAHCSLCSQMTPDFPTIRGGKAFVFWFSQDQARRSLTDGIEQYVSVCRSLLATLGETGFTEAEVRSKVRIWILDWRQSRTVPIPAIGGGIQIHNCQNMAGYCGM